MQDAGDESPLSEDGAGSGVHEVARVLDGRRLVGHDFSGADLTGSSFRGADLSEANLRGARLAGANLEGAVLHGADLTEAELLGANLEGADLSECKAERAGFGHTNLQDAHLLKARLDGASFTQASLAGADLRGASMNDARLHRCDLTRASLDRALLRGADLTEACLHRAHFFQVDLRGSRLRGVTRYASATFLGADVRDIDFSGAYLLRRQIVDENYLEEFRKSSRANGAVYWLWWLTSDCGRSILRWSVFTALITFAFGVAYTFVDIDAGSHTGPLTPYYFSLVTMTTLGFGDVLPASTTAQGLVMIEVLLGYLMLGGLLSLFSSKMGRRAD